MAMKQYMAPLQSYTTSFYRKAHALTYGCMNKYFTPFFEDADVELCTLKAHPELSTAINEDLNIIPQIATNSGDSIVNFATIVKQLGYHEINLNMGCPFPMLVKRNKGGGLLLHPELITQLLNDFYAKTTDIKLSVKMRLGTSSIDQGRDVVQLLNQFPIEELIIHPRLVTQKYSGDVNWGEFQHLCSFSQHTIIANGDINSPNDAEAIKQLQNIDTIMLGRGLLTQPHLHLLIEDKKETFPSIFSLHHHFFNLITTHFKDWNQAFNHLMSFWHYPLQVNQELKRLLRKLKKHNKPDTYQQWLLQLQNIYPN
ncbi:tRNA-dihydrouridine synthase family protein [Carboxylicivirga marina]|uniref:tRNA-dihydrouridine synthase family protein n=1 Tax=Carboxylicivirga marina TaxID=2800988 RepID=UPI002592BAAC|nr:tRNA-dihydrouridine synthase family protein [uncultured Carboxylicivirga sp.]